MKRFILTLSALLSVFIGTTLNAESLDQLLNSGERMKALSFVQKKRKNEESKLVPLIANQFFKQKTQELAELAVSYWLRNRTEAELKVLEGLKSEPDNFYLLTLKWTLLIEKNECKAVEEELKIWSNIPALDEVGLFKARVALCQKTPFELPVNPKRNKVFWGLLDIQQSFEKQDLQKLSSAITQYENLDQNIPELHWWKIKRNQQFNLPVVESAKKYLALCRNITHRQIREYLLQPYLCQQTKEAESLLK